MKAWRLTGTVLRLAANPLVRLAGDRGALVMLVLFPLLLNLILGVSLQKAFSPDFRPDRPVRVALAVEPGPRARALASALEAGAPSDLVRVVGATSAEAARRALARREVDAAVQVPAGVPGEPVRVLVEPGTLAAAITRSVVAGALAAVPAADRPAVPVEVTYRTATAFPAAGGEAGAGRPDAGDPAALPGSSRALDYYAVALGAMMIYFAAARGTESLLEDRKTGVYFRVRAGGVGRMTYFLGKIAGSMLTAILFMVVMALATRACFGVHWGDPAAWFLLTLAAALAAAGLNGVLMALVRRPEWLDGISAAVFQVLGFFGGSMMPLAIFPDALDRISRFLPNRWMLDGYLQVAAGAGIGGIADEVRVLVLMGAALLLAGWACDAAAGRAAGEV